MCLNNLIVFAVSIGISNIDKDKEKKFIFVLIDKSHRLINHSFIDCTLQFKDKMRVIAKDIDRPPWFSFA